MTDAKNILPDCGLYGRSNIAGTIMWGDAAEWQAALTKKIRSSAPERSLTFKKKKQ
jgi:hypothetical protein